ncbi:MAG: CvpA family protein [Clostridiaceae bacterium]|nr:CvpA family protein [Clostridiaceae bacterium]
MTWIDMLFIILLGFSSMIGYKKGFILTLFSLGSYVVAAFFTRLYYTELSHWLQNQAFFSSRIRYFAGNAFDLNMPTATGVTEEINSKLPTFLQQHLVNKMDLEVYAEQTMETVKYHIEGILTTFFINVVSIVLLFFVIRIIILLIGHLVNGVFQLPVLNTFNNIGGVVLGVVRGIMMILIILLIMIPISIASPEGMVSGALEASIILPLFSNNLLPYILAWL